MHNLMLRCGLLPASCLCLPLGGPCCYLAAIHEVEVPDGCVRSFEDGNGGFGFFGPGLHRVVNPWMRVEKANAKLSTGVVRNGDRCLVTVPQGQIGFVMDMGQPILLPPGLHQWRSSTMEFQELVDLNSSVIRLGPYTCLTVDEGYSAVTQNNGKQVILAGGGVHLLTHRNWKFEKFVSHKIQTDNLERLEATSADNVLMTVSSTINWRIFDVGVAARMSAETMGARVDNMDKMRNDVLKQAEASLSSFIGTVNYSGSFALAAAHLESERDLGGKAVAAHSAPEEPHGSPLFDLRQLANAVTQANAVTRQYGVEIISINIMTAKPADPILVNSLAKGAVAAAEAQQAETAARGNANAAKIAAEGEAQAQVTRARGAAEADRIRADGAKAAADTLQSSPVAVALAQIDRTGAALEGASASYFFGADAQKLGSLLSNPAVIQRK
eukprot:Transcript_9102.p1 GENE.Transcript_9102~~Transcript_9102.p1  ORF type:complete len:491 (-),score=217.66 Transcript_9102:1036-2361(-)